MALLAQFSELSYGLCHQSFSRWNNWDRRLCSHELDSFPLLNPCCTEYHHCPSFQAALQNSTDSADVPELSIGKDGFQVYMDVRQFAPNEISIKIVDNSIVVEAKHLDEHNHVALKFKRRYAIPDGFNIKAVETQLSSDGILTINAPPEAAGPVGLNSGNQYSDKSTDQESKESPVSM